ncbi:hypothetical protein U370_03795 [Anaplasma marginale str. Dawn]|nr:hypothetical protein U128_03940 [Anaplasma marginale str. Gypsy Plains]AGZ79891.1 hypothetical protein U370_03795 [Anaplasma marginale str. Dawn]
MEIARLLFQLVTAADAGNIPLTMWVGALHLCTHSDVHHKHPSGSLRCVIYTQERCLGASAMLHSFAAKAAC